MVVGMAAASFISPLCMSLVTSKIFVNMALQGDGAGGKCAPSASHRVRRFFANGVQRPVKASTGLEKIVAEQSLNLLRTLFFLGGGGGGGGVALDRTLTTIIMCS